MIPTLAANVYKNFRNKPGMFAPGNPLQPSQMFVGEAGAYP